jgi:hypothetical protein
VVKRRKKHLRGAESVAEWSHNQPNIKMNTEKSEIKRLKAQAKADFIAENTAKWVSQEEAEEEAENEGRPLDYSFGAYDILMSELQEQAKNDPSPF